MSTAVKEAPKDEAVAAEVKARQMGLFDGFQVEALDAKLKASDSIYLEAGEPIAKFGDRRTFLVDARVAEISHKSVKVNLGHGTTIERFTRVAVFDIETANELTPKVQELIKNAMEAQRNLAK